MQPLELGGVLPRERLPRGGLLLLVEAQLPGPHVPREQAARLEDPRGRPGVGAAELPERREEVRKERLPGAHEQQAEEAETLGGVGAQRGHGLQDGAAAALRWWEVRLERRRGEGGRAGGAARRGAGVRLDLDGDRAARPGDERADGGGGEVGRRRERGAQRRSRGPAEGRAMAQWGGSSSGARSAKAPPRHQSSSIA